MEDYLLKIKTSRTAIALPIVAIILSLYLMLIQYDPIGRTPPWVLFILMSLALLAEWKTIYVYQGTICIRYVLVLIKRNITIDRVSSVTIVIKGEECRLLFALDQCPAFTADKTHDCDTYCLKHLFKVIPVRCNKEEALACKHFFDRRHIQTDMIYKNIHNQRLGE